MAAVAFVAVLFVVWRTGVLAAHGDPVGVDIGNVLRIARSWQGGVDVDDVVYPPIVPLLAWSAQAVVGTAWAAHLLQGLASVAPALGVWAVSRWFRGPAVAAAAGLAVGVATGTSAAAAWGGVPQLLGLGLLPGVVLAADRWVRAPDRRRALVWGGGLLLVMMISTLVAGAAVVASVVTIVVTVLVGVDRSVGSRLAALLRSVGWALAPPALAIPWYVDVARVQSLPDGRSTELRGTAALTVVLGPPAWLWWGVAAAAIIATAAALRRDQAGSTVAIGLLAAALVGLLIGEVRAAYVVPTALATALALTWPVGSVDRPTTERKRDARASLARAAVAWSLVAWMVVLAPSRFGDQVVSYGRFTPDGTLRAARWLADRAVVGDRVVAAPVDGVPTGWWIEAEGVDAWVAARAEWLFFPGERRTAAVAEELLSAASWPDGGALERLEACGVDWVVLPAAWGGVDEDALDRAVAAGRVRIAFDDGVTTVLAVGGSAANAESDVTVPAWVCPIS